jgi:peptidyl-prolyl cis-trans isomerase C
LQRILSSLLVVSLVGGVACRKGSTPEVSAAAQTSGSQQSAPTAPQPAKPMPAQLPDVLARVNGEAVTKADFDRLVRNMELGNGPVPAERRDEILRGALDQLVTYTVLQQEAKARHITITDGEVESRMAAMQRQFPDEKAFQKALADRNMTLERLRADARVDMVINKLLDEEMSKQPAPTDAQVREFYDKRPEKFKEPETVRASHVLVKVDEQADAATRQKARAKIEGVLKQARSGADFAKLAREHSDDGSAQQGGDLSYFARGQMVRPFEEAAFALKPGEVSDVVTTQFGYHVIKVTDRKPGAPVPFERVSDRIKQHLTEQGKQEHAKAFIDGLKNKSKIEVLV